MYRNRSTRAHGIRPLHMCRCSIIPATGYSDWRLPTSKELQTLLDYNRKEPAATFPNTESAAYVSSTAYAEYTGAVVSVDFAAGYVSPDDKSFNFAVRAVRGGECRANGDWCIDENDCSKGEECFNSECQTADR